MIVVIVLLLIIAGLCALLLSRPAPTDMQQTDSAQQPPETQSPTEPQTVTTTSGVTVTEPQQGATVGGTFTVSGDAPNNWYFEASFPIQVRDSDDNVIGRGQAQAQSDWTKTGMVPFTAAITIGSGYRGPATLILMKDNPSGLPENDDATTIDIVIGS